MERDVKTVESVSEYIKLITEISQNRLRILTDDLELTTDEIEKYILNGYPREFYTRESVVRYLEYTNEVVKVEYKKWLDFENKASFRNKVKLFYRGQYKGSYDLISGVFRKDDIGNSNADKEDYYWHEAHVRCSEFFEHSTHLDNLVTMQHFGFPTRLLDITSNPLVALFFSCKNYGCSRCNTADTGKVFGFAYC